MISHRLMSGCVVDGWSGVWESGEDPGWNLSYTCSTRCCPVLLHRLLIALIFQCGLPKETLVLKNVLFCVVLVPKPQRGTLVFSHIRRLGLFFLVQIPNFNMFGGFQKNEYFWGYEDFVDIFWGSSQNCASLRVISMQFRIFF